MVWDEMIGLLRGGHKNVQWVELIDSKRMLRGEGG
jgi:hypothetical protein